MKATATTDSFRSLTFLSLSAIFRNMARSPSFAGVILAAGDSSRMGTDKALLPWPPQIAGQPPSKDTFLSAAICSLMSATDFVLIVAGKNEAALAPIVYAGGASLVSNPDPDRGQFSSLQVGLHEVLNRGRDAAIITLVDRPPVSAVTVQLLRDALDLAPDNIWAVVPEFSGKHGHPYVAGRELMEVFLQAPATASAREVERRYQDHIQYVEVSDPSVALNINTPEDYAALSLRG
ncbi:MAG TPA: nucleotidyltransferase family protein [Candidatus Sulfotelmatobacter sp.]|nr:nucleotidyltransferase family protein [Candidatus Sulfotelmatobacter sp.]